MEIKYLALSGGGSKGFAYIGCLRFLYEKGFKCCDLNEIAGTSIGAFVAMLCCLGYTPDEMEKVSKTIEMSSLLRFSIRHFSQSYGFDNGFNLEKMIQNMIKNKNLPENITLSELYEKTKIKFHVITASVSRKTTVIMNHETFADIKLSTAVKISMSIPFLYGYTNIKGDLLVDGGLTLNFPISVFKDHPYKQVLGMYLTNEHSYEETNSAYNIQTYITDTLYCLINQIEINQKEEIKRQALSRNYENVILLNIEKEFALKLDMTEEEKHKLIEYGYSAACDFFKGRSSEMH